MPESSSSSSSNNKVPRDILEKMIFYAGIRGELIFYNHRKGITIVGPPVDCEHGRAAHFDSPNRAYPLDDLDKLEDIEGGKLICVMGNNQLGVVPGEKTYKYISFNTEECIPEWKEKIEGDDYVLVSTNGFSRHDTLRWELERNIRKRKP